MTKFVPTSPAGTLRERSESQGESQDLNTIEFSSWPTPEQSPWPTRDTPIIGLERLGPVSRCLVMGILNLTPDSFSDGGQLNSVDAAWERALQMAREGVDILDVGGESTRPGAQRVTEAEEIARVIPVVERLAKEGFHVSVDTMRAAVARAAVGAGALIVNDVSGGLADPLMAPTIAELGVTYICSHWRAPSDQMDAHAEYVNDDVVTAVVNELRGRLRELEVAGVKPEQLILDPGLGFAKQTHHNWALLAGMDALHALGRPILIGASRKRFIGEALGDFEATGEFDAQGHPEQVWVQRPVDQRDDATAAISALSAAAGAWGVRVHEVRASYDAAIVAKQVEVAAAGPGPGPFSYIGSLSKPALWGAVHQADPHSPVPHAPEEASA